MSDNLLRVNAHSLCLTVWFMLCIMSVKREGKCGGRLDTHSGECYNCPTMSHPVCKKSVRATILSVDSGAWSHRNVSGNVSRNM